MGIRSRLLRLGFVEESEAGVNYWKVKSSGNFTQDFFTGRVWAIKFLELIRDTGFPGLTHYVADAMALDTRIENTALRGGFLTEITEAISASPRSATPTCVMANQWPLSGDIPEQLASLPFIRREEDGSLNYWTVESSGDYAEDCARGRFYAGLAARVIRQGVDYCLLGEIHVSSLAQPGVREATQDIRAAMVGELGAIAAASDPHRTALSSRVLSKNPLPA